MSKVTNIRPYIARRLRKEVRERDEKYCEHCGMPKDECPGYKCWT